MRKTFAAIACIFLLLSSVANAQEKIRIATGEWAPYTSEFIDGYGFFAEIVTAVFKEMGMETDYEFHPWTRCETLLKKGEVFAAMPYVITDERRKAYDFSNVVAVSTGRFFYLKSRFPSEISWSQFSDLKPYKIGGVLGYWYEKPFVEGKFAVEFIQSEEEIMKRLQAGRVDFVPMDELVGWQLIKKIAPSHQADFDTLKKPTNASELHLMISKSYPNSNEIREKFNVALRAIRKNGTYAEILKKYNIKE